MMSHFCRKYKKGNVAEHYIPRYIFHLKERKSPITFTLTSMYSFETEKASSSHLAKTKTTVYDTLTKEIPNLIIIHWSCIASCHSGQEFNTVQ